MTATVREKDTAKKVVVDFLRRHERAFDRSPHCGGIRFDKLEEKPLELLVGYVRLYNATFEKDFGSLEYAFHQSLKYAEVFDIVSSIKIEVVYNNPSYAPPEGIVYYEMEFTNIVGEARGDRPGVYDTGFTKYGRLICWEVPCEP